MRHASRPFIFSASIPPASCAVALAALRYLEAHPELVSRLAALSIMPVPDISQKGSG